MLVSRGIRESLFTGSQGKQMDNPNDAEAREGKDKVPKRNRDSNLACAYNYTGDEEFRKSESSLEVAQLRVKCNGLTRELSAAALIKIDRQKHSCETLVSP